MAEPTLVNKNSSAAELVLMATQIRPLHNLTCRLAAKGVDEGV